MKERELLRHVYDGKYDYVLNTLIKEIVRQDKVIQEQGKLLKELVSKVDGTAKMTKEIAVSMEEPQDKSLNDILDEFIEKN